MIESKIILIAPYPPKYGGISVHAYRMCDILQKYNINYELYDTQNEIHENKTHNIYPAKKIRQKVCLYLKLICQKNILIHLHSPSFWARISFAMYALIGKKVILHVHGASLKEVRKDIVKYYCLKLLSRRVVYLVDNKEIELCARDFNPKDIKLIDAYIPENKYGLNEFPKALRKPKSDEICIFSMGWHEEYQGAPLYGFDILLTALSKVLQSTDAHLYLKILGTRCVRESRRFKDTVEKLNIGTKITIIDEEIDNMNAIYENIDIYVRAARSDGSSLSVKEAIECGATVLASDSVARPENVHLYQTEDADELARKIVKIGKRTISQKKREVALENNGLRICKEIYGIQGL